MSADVQQAVLHFPRGTSAGVSVLLPSQLFDLIRVLNTQQHAGLFGGLTKLVKNLEYGKMLLYCPIHRRSSRYSYNKAQWWGKTHSRRIKHPPPGWHSSHAARQRPRSASSDP